MNFIELLSQEQVTEFLLQDSDFQNTGVTRITYLDYQYRFDRQGRRVLFCRVLTDTLQEKTYKLYDDYFTTDFQVPTQSELFMWFLTLALYFGEDYLRYLEKLSIKRLNSILNYKEENAFIGIINALNSTPQSLESLKNNGLTTIDASIAFLRKYVELVSPSTAAILKQQIPKNKQND